MNISAQNRWENFYKNRQVDELLGVESMCGPGSTTWYTEAIRESLPRFLKKHGFKSMIDLPCGDHWWMKNIELPKDIKYIGSDIVTDFINNNKKNWPEKEWMIIDATEDYYPAVDVVFCRDLLFHLDNDKKLRFLQNFLRSSSSFLLMSNHPRHTLNKNVPEETGFEPVNWNIEPWNFCQSLDFIVDYIEENEAFRKYPYRTMELWSREQILIGLNENL